MPVVVPPPPTLAPGFALPMAFAPNLGQGPDGSAYLAQGAYGIALAPDGLTLSLSPAARNTATPTPPELIHLHFAGPRRSQPASSPARNWWVASTISGPARTR